MMVQVVSEKCENNPPDWTDPEGFSCSYFDEDPRRCDFVPDWKISRGRTALSRRALALTVTF